MRPDEVRDEIANWSSTILKQIAEEEQCSHFFRRMVMDELKDRGMTREVKPEPPPPPKPELKKKITLPGPIKKSIQMTQPLDREFDSMFRRRF